MKKVFCVSLLALMLVCLLCASALAQTTGIAMDGKVYTFTGGEGTYQADGKTFIIGVESVVVQEPGLPDRVLELHQTEASANRMAMAFPIPLAAPVTIATFPSSNFICYGLSY